MTNGEEREGSEVNALQLGPCVQCEAEDQVAALVRGKTGGRAGKKCRSRLRMRRRRQQQQPQEACGYLGSPFQSTLPSRG